MNLQTVTITGADDSIDPSELGELSKKYPFVEWGILVSESSQGQPRFPSDRWIDRLFGIHLKKNPKMRLSLHVCGKWVRDICKGNWNPLSIGIGSFMNVADRIQLNFHAYEHLLTDDFTPSAIKESNTHNWEIIFQCDGINDHLVSAAHDAGLNCSQLFDKSGGAGVVPNEWPGPTNVIYSGYAGGLGHHNLALEIPRIEKASLGDPYWIDMETKVRSDNDMKFDLVKVTTCLEISSTFMNEWNIKRTGETNE